MDAQWITSPTGRRVLEHWADPRPSWLWSADGQTLLWRNIAARWFHGRTKVREGRPAPEATPIRGQVARLIRLGSLNRASLSRMQFLAGDRPISATCACTPLHLADGETALLVVDVDPIAQEFLDTPQAVDPRLEALFPPGADYLLIDDDVQIAGGSPHALESYAPLIESEGLPPLDAELSGTLYVDGRQIRFTRFKASPQDATLLLFSGSAEGGAASQAAPLPRETAEPLLPLGLPAVTAEPAPPPLADDHWVEPIGETPSPTGGLTSLFDRLLDDSALFEPLRADEDFVRPMQSDAGVETAPDVRAEPEAPLLPEASDVPAPVDVESEESVTVVAEAAPSGELPPEAPIAPEVSGEGVGTAPLAAAETAPEIEADAAVQAPEIADPPATVTLYRLIGRGFTPIETYQTPAAPAAEPPPLAPTEPAPLLLAAPAADSAATGTPYPNLEDLLADLPPAEPAALEPAPLSESPPAEPVEVAESEAAPASEPLPPGEIEPPAGAVAPTPDAEAVERVSRYNFDELSRILNDRVGNGTTEPGDRVAAFTPRPPLPTVPSATPEGALVTLGGETLVLNRLPLGILVFRDQQVLFANRAITEMTGYDSVEALRNAGLAAIFPAAADEAPEAGPVNHLVQRNGVLVPVTARLQSVSWQGKPALMLSASATEVRTGHEAAVKAFAEMLATTRGDGFFDTGRSGVISMVSAEACRVLKLPEELLLGRPIVQLASPEAGPALKEFLERPARFAETARPAITVKGADPAIEIMIFAQGQAGVVSSYFGFVRRKDGSSLPALAGPQRETDPALLGRLSRGVRRPLNTVIGFSDLIGSAAFGPIENERYIEYARDIKTAGVEIAALVDELDDFARLRDGRYAARPTDIDLVSLLESSVTRVRSQANAARVLVRSAISERLPRIRADRASLAQAILNLLASAIDESPQDGSVVLSAQADDEGGVVINVRDSAQHTADIAERFVVFRDGVGRDGEVLTPVRSSVGLALTRALLAVNAASLSVEPMHGPGMLFSLTISPDNVVITNELPAGA